MATQHVEPLSDSQLADLLDLTKQADSVELKLTVPDSKRLATVAALGLDPLDAHLRQVYFFDTPDLRLDTHGVVVRARRIQGRPDDSVVKLRPVRPEAIETIRSFGDVVVEVDAMPGGYVCSASLSTTLDTTGVKHVAAGRRGIRKLYSKDQRRFFESHAPEGLALDDLAILGPITVLKLKQTPEGFGRKLVAELWFYPDGTMILELSTKCTPSEAFQVAAEAKAYLLERGVDIAGPQQTKTRAALECFT